EALHRRALALLERLSNCYEPVGDYGKALQFALRYAELEPWDEGAHRRVMRLYALSGQKSAALVQYDACCRLLKKELDVLPSQETQHLAERIRNGELLVRPPDTAAAPPQTIAQPPAERRHVTVLYCELALAGIDDPDEAMELLDVPQTRCVEIIRQFSGHIVQTHGGGLLAYFGYPQAREDSARRAVQAALAVTRETAHGVEVRAGVHTGLIITSGDPSLPDPVGRTSRLAIELRHSAAHNEVAISQHTRGIVAGYFDCISLGVRSLPDSIQPLEVFKVERETGARTRLDAATLLAPLVGRQAEIAQLMGLWEEARQGASHMVLVQGEPGIGKSRLLHALKQRLADQPHALRELRCFPEFSQSPFHPLLLAFEVIWGFAPDDTPEVKSGKLAQCLERDYPALAQEAVPLLASLLFLPIIEPYRASGLTPQKQKELTIDILLAMLKVLAARIPVLFIVEDLHWIDPSTLELLSLLVGQKGARAMLTVFTVRPEFIPPWKNSATSTLAIAPLAGSEIEQMIVSISGGIPAVTVRHIVDRADGVPLFAEEMAKIATLDNRASIPATLHDLLAARMDRMGEAKYTAQVAATLGREFGLDLLRRVSTCGPETLARSLSALQAAGLILKVDETTCQFKHVLIQEAAYQSQTRADRQAAHRRIAQALQSDFPDVVASQPELLAQHFSSGGEIRQSIDYWIKAGKRAAQRSANLEAVAHFISGLKVLMTLPATRERDPAEFSILNDLWSVLQTTQGYGSEEVIQIAERISVLRKSMDDSSTLFLTEWKRLRSTLASGISSGTSEAAINLLCLAQNDTLSKQGAHYLCAVAFFWLGEFNSARIHAEKAMSLHQPDQRQRMIELFGEDIFVSFAGYLSVSLHFLGFPKRAQQVCGQMLDYARQTEHPNTLAMASFYASALHRWLNRYTDTLNFSAETIAVTRKHDMTFWALSGEMFHNWARVMQGEKAASSELESNITHLITAARGRLAFLLVFLIETHVRLKMYCEALPLIAQAQVDMVNTDDGHCAAEVQRLKGICLLALAPSNEKEAESCFDQALAISRRQGAKILELRAAVSMARLWQQQGKHDQARRMLGKIHKWFTEGFDTPDLQEAANLLATSASGGRIANVGKT
ncbi:MAG: AAA family ATPase, partial [Alphaproteobacteria bacterium]|nr:AAA family ATPase [Alphaproteobacteria bacterium]